VAKAQRRAAYLAVWPVLVLFALVLGGIYFGVFTPTEASGIGAVGAALFAYCRGSLTNLSTLLDILVETVRTTATIFAVIFGAFVFANFINLSGLPYDLLDWVEEANLGPLGLVGAVCVICILMGMVFEAVGILLLIVPVFLPSLIALDIDLIWFGIVMVVVVEMGLITPPIGMNVFTVRTVMPDIKLTHIFAGVMPFVYADIVTLLLIIFIPSIAVGILQFT
jgi:tripartite ATP-independent transporter DctM subunit